LTGAVPAWEVLAGVGIADAVVFAAVPTPLSPACTGAVPLGGTAPTLGTEEEAAATVRESLGTAASNPAGPVPLDTVSDRPARTPPGAVGTTGASTPVRLGVGDPLATAPPRPRLLTGLPFERFATTKITAINTATAATMTETRRTQ